MDDREGQPGWERIWADCGAGSAGLPNHQRLPQAAFEGARCAVPAGSEAVRDGRAGQTRPCGAGWHEDQGECVETHERMKKREAELKAEVARMLAAEAADCDED